jgi:ABC-2 type transport system ATP-binding protein
MMEIAVKALSKDFGNVKALRDINLSMAEGMYGLLGPNGAGKTTLMRIMATVLPPDSGTATYDGFDIVREPEHVRRLIGYLPQSFGVYKEAPVKDLLDYVGVLKGLPKRRVAGETRRVLEIVNLADKASVKVKNLSGGMLRRLGIAQALVADPKVLIVDEPTTGLDPEERTRFRNLLTELSLTKCIMLSTHIVSDIEASCSEVFILGGGRLLYSGEPQNLAAFSEGRVWNLELTLDEFSRMSREYKVLNIRRRRNSFCIQVLSPAPVPNGVPEPPTVEYGYTCLLDCISSRDDESYPTPELRGEASSAF